MIDIILALLAATIAHAQTPGTNGTVLRDLAGSRFYGAAANTSFLFVDPVYTEVISTQVRLSQLFVLHQKTAADFKVIPKYSIFTCENESESYVNILLASSCADAVELLSEMGHY